MSKRRRRSRGQVFINCPFDEAYHALLRPLLFTIVYLGFTPRIASERSDGGELRLSKIRELIASSDHGIHDLSRVRAEEAGEFYRLNMPFELGVDYGYRTFSNDAQGRKLLIMGAAPYDHMKALSDLSGIDIKDHDNKPVQLVRRVRNWFVETVGLRGIEPGSKIWYEFTRFMADFFDRRKTQGFQDEDLQMMPVVELIEAMEAWVVAG